MDRIKAFLKSVISSFAWLVGVVFILGFGLWYAVKIGTVL